jgi:cobalt-precorrin 5A hydrolase
MGGDQTMSGVGQEMDSGIRQHDNRGIVAGIGCRKDCPVEDVLAVVREACLVSGRSVRALAAPEFKRDEAGLHDAAGLLGVPLILVGAGDLVAAQPRCVTRSAIAERAIGTGSVAEGCALAAAGAGSMLILPRIAGARATCALAEAAS